MVRLLKNVPDYLRCLTPINNCFQNNKVVQSGKTQLISFPLSVCVGIVSDEHTNSHLSVNSLGVGGKTCCLLLGFKGNENLPINQKKIDLKLGLETKHAVPCCP